MHKPRAGISSSGAARGGMDRQAATVAATWIERGGAGAPERMAMRYGGGARLDMESPLLRGVEAPESRTAWNRSAQRKRPTVQAGTSRVGRLSMRELTRRVADVSLGSLANWAVLDRWLPADGLEERTGEQLPSVRPRGQLGGIFDPVGQSDRDRGRPELFLQGQ
jgi:hypothetical protein